MIVKWNRCKNILPSNVICIDKACQTNHFNPTHSAISYVFIYFIMWKSKLIGSSLQSVNLRKQKRFLQNRLSTI